MRPEFLRSISVNQVEDKKECHIMLEFAKGNRRHHFITGSALLFGGSAILIYSWFSGEMGEMKKWFNTMFFFGIVLLLGAWNEHRFIGRFEKAIKEDQESRRSNIP